MARRSTVDEKITSATRKEGAELNLGWANLTELPERIRTLTNLKSLKLNDNRITRLPDWIGDLKHLQNLEISGNNLVILPDSLTNLTNLTTLILSNNNLNRIPSSIGNLHRLFHFDISNNNIAAIPPSIGTLSDLSKLHMKKCGLMRLPNSLNKLTRLTELNISSNRLANSLSQLPKDNLKILDLSNNGIFKIPTSLRYMPKIKNINLSSNDIYELPQWIEYMTYIEILDLRNNPINIPQELLNDWQNPHRILKYFSDLRKGERRPLNEAKTILVGEAKNGKTSLVKRLRGEEFDVNETKTDGIDIIPWEYDFGDRKIKLNVWDLGGQEIYHATHQFFLTERTLYILVLNSRQSESQNRLDYWLKTIRTLGKDAPILVVQNQHETNPYELNRKQLKEKYPTIQNFFQTSCAPNTEKGISDLQNEIKIIISTMPHVSDQVPGSYFRVKERLERDKRDFLTFTEYKSICDEENLTDTESQQVLVRLLHQLGTLLNFQDDFRLSDTNVLNPEWVTDAVYKIIDYPALRETGNAILRPEMLTEILQADRYPIDKQRYIIEMMAKFELGFERNGDWLIPELLSPEEPDDTGDFTNALRFEYHYDFLPSSVLPRFIVRTHTLKQTQYWRDGVVLEEGNNKARIRADLDDRKIKVEVTGIPNTRRDLLAMIRREFAHIHNTLKGMDCEEMVLIPGYPDAKPVSYKFLLELECDREETFRCEGVPVRVSVSELLNGIEAKRFTPSEPELSPPKPPKKEEAKPMNGVNLDEELKPLSDIIKVTNDNDSYLRELARAVQKDKVVPFVGAGMSQPVGMKGWVGTLDDIFADAKPSLSIDAAMAFATAKATGKLDEAAQVLWDTMKEKWFNDRIKSIFGSNILPARAEAIQAAPISLLPKIANGPVITTNFDAILETVYGDFDLHRDIILGDYRTDEMLEDFDDKRHFLLKLHGDADQKWGRVLTQAQYNRAYSTDKEISRLPELLQEIARSRRPLLFLGCSLELDRTVQELKEAGLMTSNAIHFALLKDPGDSTRTARRNFLVGELGIKPIWLRSHDDIRPVLEFLVRVRA